MPREIKNFGTRKEDILNCSGGGISFLICNSMTFEDVGDHASDVTRPKVAENTFNDSNNSPEEPVPLFVVLRTRKKDNKQKGKKISHTDRVWLAEKGTIRFLIKQNIPCSGQLMNNTMKRWCEYQNRSKLALRTFALENNTMTPRQVVIYRS